MDYNYQLTMPFFKKKQQNNSYFDNSSDDLNSQEFVEKLQAETERLEIPQPDPPIIYMRNVSTNHVLIDWIPNTHLSLKYQQLCDQFIIEYKRLGVTEWKETQLLTHNKCFNKIKRRFEFTIKNLNDNTDYVFRVKGRNHGDPNNWSTYSQSLDYRTS